jgi:hypothetical protein
MARIAGIQIEKDSKGRPAFVRFDLKKHPEALELLTKLGAGDDEFEQEWSRRVSGIEVRAQLHQHIDEIFNDDKR